MDIEGRSAALICGDVEGAIGDPKQAPRKSADRPVRHRRGVEKHQHVVKREIHTVAPRQVFIGGEKATLDTVLANDRCAGLTRGLEATMFSA